MSLSEKQFRLEENNAGLVRDLWAEVERLRQEVMTERLQKVRFGRETDSLRADVVRLNKAIERHVCDRVPLPEAKESSDARG